MPLEIEFLPVGTGASSGDAILARYSEGNRWRVMVVDGGYEETGRSVCEHVRQYYGTELIDYLISTHPDNDHISGLRIVLEQMRVGELWTHVPFLHAETILPLFASRRWTTEGLQRELRQAYPSVSELVRLAQAQGTAIKLPFQGEHVGAFRVLSPSIEMYNGLLPQVRDTPQPDQALLSSLGHWLQGIGRRIAKQIRLVISEDWYSETLREGGMTSAENESSVVLYADLGSGGILLTSDVGLRGLDAAVRYAASTGISMRDHLWLFQVPHHGSRNNISPSALNLIIGSTLAPGNSRRTHCAISAGREDETHPRQVVLNGLIRRGLKPIITRGATKRFQDGMPQRQDWVAAVPASFSNVVEAYD
jgi:beta-lactamase superfamily II metal-dependent hydrolase